MNPREPLPRLSLDRASARLTFARNATHTRHARLEPASEDASARSYWRIHGTSRSAIVMDAPPGSGDLGAWLDVDARVRAVGLNAPAVLAEDRAQGFLLLSDLGPYTYLSQLSDTTADALYTDALGALRTMQTRIDPEGLPHYDAGLLRDELALLRPWFLERHLGILVDDDAQTVIDTAFDLLVANALGQPQTFVHRDFHSRNLMFVRPDNPGIIDLQDAVLGPVTYDLVSLLRDCYIAWDDLRVRDWSEGHRLCLIEAGALDAGIDATRWRRWFDLTGLQRHLKVLGIFCRLWYRDGKHGYLADLPRVWRYVRSVAACYPELHDFLALLGRRIDTRDLTQPASS